MESVKITRGYKTRRTKHRHEWMKHLEKIKRFNRIRDKRKLYLKNVVYVCVYVCLRKEDEGKRTTERAELRSERKVWFFMKAARSAFSLPGSFAGSSVHLPFCHPELRRDVVFYAPTGEANEQIQPALVSKSSTESNSTRITITSRFSLVLHSPSIELFH